MYSKRQGVSLTITLAVSISLLVLIAVVSVLGLGLVSGTRNTMSLLREQAELAVASMVDKVSTHLGAARNQLVFVSSLIENGKVDLENEQRLLDVMTGSLAAAPQISAILFMSPQLKTTIVARTPNGPQVFRRDDDSGDRAMVAALSASRQAREPAWGDPLWRDLPKETMLNLRMPVRRNGEFVGMLIAAVSIRRLSSFLAELGKDVRENAFILYDRHQVIAHASLATNPSTHSRERPLPRLIDIGDAKLAAMWQSQDRYPLRLIEGTDLKGHVLQIDGEEYIYIYRESSEFGRKTWQIGTYLRSADVSTELMRLERALIAGLAMLALSVFVAIMLARRIAWPIVKLAGAASRIGQLEISETQELPGSMFRELNDQARAFNAMLKGLRWFEAYVPKKLVMRLIQQGENGVASSEERQVTVMFTDIVGFTTLSEDISATQLADILNHHFALLAGCIEAEDGTVDKFIGDSVMAFWGAPDVQTDHAERAVRAARQIQVVVEQENGRRRQRGEQPIRVRLGLHSGRVTVGNIGAPGRINYTIIGDVVNVAQRIEQLGKDLAGDQPRAATVTVLTSAATVDQLSSLDGVVSTGLHKLRGRDEEIEVYVVGPKPTPS